jgi:hypothetical protein
MFLTAPGKRRSHTAERFDSRPAPLPASPAPRLARFALPLLTAGFLGLAATLVLPDAAEAQYGTPNEDAKIIVHVVPVASAGGRPCSGNKGRAPCDQMLTNGKVGEYYYAFVCVVDGKADVGIAGVQFGVKFNRANRVGIDISEWTKCGTLEFAAPTSRRDWYNVSNGGNLITWDPENACQDTEPSGGGTGVTAVAGYFYLTAYGADRIEVTPRPADKIAAVADCNSFLSIVAGAGAPIRARSFLGSAEFSADGSVLGANPCGLARPIVDKTWTGVKQTGR